MAACATWGIRQFSVLYNCSRSIHPECSCTDYESEGEKWSVYVYVGSGLYKQDYPNLLGHFIRARF